MKIFLWLQAAGVEQGFASSGWCFLPPLVQSLSDRFLREATGMAWRRGAEALAKHLIVGGWGTKLGAIPIASG